jgi:16S rRNA (guanine527-N7)-methyltransferase
VATTPSAGSRVEPDPEAVERRFDRLAELLAGSAHNLVSRRERATVRAVHLPECAQVAAHLPLEPGARWVDLGTGGGLPGLVLAILRPDVTWTLIDATTKKIAAVRSFAQVLKIDNVQAVAGRAEALGRDPEYRSRFDGVVSRALGRLVVAAELSRGFVRPGGWVVAVKGPRWPQELSEASAGLTELGLRHVSTVEMPSLARATWLVTMRADGTVPRRFPRPDGIPRSRPLGRNGQPGGHDGSPGAEEGA